MYNKPRNSREITEYRCWTIKWNFYRSAMKSFCWSKKKSHSTKSIINCYLLSSNADCTSIACLISLLQSTFDFNLFLLHELHIFRRFKQFGSVEKDYTSGKYWTLVFCLLSWPVWSIECALCAMQIVCACAGHKMHSSGRPFNPIYVICSQRS